MGTKNYNNALDLVSFSRASGGTALRKISYGPELVTNGTFDEGVSGWDPFNFQSEISVVSGEMTATATASTVAMGVAQDLSLTIGKAYVVTGTLRIAGGAENVELSITNNARNAFVARGESITSATNVTTSLTFVATETNNVLYLRNGRAASATGWTGGFFDNISVKEVLFDQPDGTLTLFNHPDDIPRIEYDTSGNPKGILIEEQRTNLQIYSEDFSDVSWYTPTAFLTTDAAVSPDGRTNAAKLGGTSGSTNMRLQQSVSLSAGTTYTYSIFAKAGEFTTLRTQRVDTNLDSWGTVFDLSSGTVTSGVGNMEDFGNGWYRCSGEAVCNTSATTGVLYVCEPGGTGDGTSGIYVYGAQLEAGSFPTSYIPTSGASATREADIASIDVDQFGYNKKAGSVVVEGTYFNTGITPILDSSNINERERLYYQNNEQLLVVDGGVIQANLSGASLSGSFGIAYAVKSNDFSLVSSGVVRATDTSGTPPIISSYSLGKDLAGRYLNGHIKSLKYYPRRLSNAQLQELTS